VHICCSGKPISTAYSECVFVALGIQHAMRMRCIVMSPVWLFIGFSTLSHKRHDFRGGGGGISFQKKVFFFFFLNFFFVLNLLYT